MSFSSFCGIHIYTYFSRANLNTSCSCHSVPSLCPPQLTGRSAAALAPQYRLFRHYLTLKIELDKKVLSDLSYLPVKNSNKWIFLWHLSVPTWSVSCSFWVMVTEQQQRINTQFARKEHSWCEETPERVRPALFPTISVHMGGNRIKKISDTTAASLLLLGSMWQLLSPGYETRRATMALQGHGAAPAAEGSLAEETHLACFQELGVDPSPNPLLR